MSNSKVASSKKTWSRMAVCVLTSLAASGLCTMAVAAPDIEQAPRLSNEDYGAELYPGSYAIAIPVGEAGFYPSGAVRLSSVNNLLFQQEEDEIGATQLRVIPKLDLVAEGSKSVFWGVFRADLKKHSGDDGVEDADTSDYRVRGFGHIDIDNRNRVDLELSHSRLSEELGTGRTSTLVSQIGEQELAPDTYDLSRLGLTYSYGNPRSRGELVAGLSLGSLEYVENKDALAQYDRDMSLLWGRFSYKLTGKTTLFSRLSFRDYEYTEDNSAIGENRRRDREATSVTLGANWNSTGLWYGNAHVSFSDWEYTKRTSSAGNPNSGSDTTWEANLYWAIRSYSNANFYVRQFIDDDDVGGSSKTTKTSTMGVRWRHGWSERFNTTVAAYNSFDELDNTKSNERQVVSLEGRLSIRRWLSFLVGVSVDSLDSDDLTAKRQFSYVGLEGNL